MKADEKVASGASLVTHRMGRGGYHGIIAKFVNHLTMICGTLFRPRLSCMSGLLTQVWEKVSNIRVVIVLPCVVMDEEMMQIERL